MGNYAPNLGGVARRMQDRAQMAGNPQLFAVGELLEHIQHLDSEGEGDITLTALGCSVAFAWLIDSGSL